MRGPLPVFPCAGSPSKIGNRVSAQQIGKYERDEDVPGSGVLIALSEALGVPLDYLVGDQEMVLDGVEFRKKQITSKKEEAHSAGTGASPDRALPDGGGNPRPAERRMGQATRGAVPRS